MPKVGCEILQMLAESTETVYRSDECLNNIRIIQYALFYRQPCVSLHIQVHTRTMPQRFVITWYSSNISDIQLRSLIILRQSRYSFKNTKQITQDPSAIVQEPRVLYYEFMNQCK